MYWLYCGYECGKIFSLFYQHGFCFIMKVCFTKISSSHLYSCHEMICWYVWTPRPAPRGALLQRLQSGSGAGRHDRRHECAAGGKWQKLLTGHHGVTRLREETFFCSHAELRIFSECCSVQVLGAGLASLLRYQPRLCEVSHRIPAQRRGGRLFAVLRCRDQ